MSSPSAPGRADWQALVRNQIQELSKIAPDAAAHLALDAFLTPSPSRPSLMERKLQETALKETLRVGAQEVMTYAWGDGPLVLLAHGWGGRGTQLGAFVAPLVGAGYRVMTFDAPAHGASTGQQTNILEFAMTIQAISQEWGPLHAVIGHSLGAAAILLAESQFALRANCFVLIGCFAIGQHLTESFGRLLQMPAPILARMAQLMHDRFEGRLDWENLSIPEMARASHMPILLIHDKDDREIPYTDARLIAGACRQCQLLTTEGQGHHKILRDAAVIGQGVSFVSASRTG